VTTAVTILVVAVLGAGCALSHGPGAGDGPGGTCEPGEACDCRAALEVPAGTHWVGRGSDPPDPCCLGALDGPAHRVTLTRAAWLGRFEAAAGCYARCVAAGACLDDLPWPPSFGDWGPSLPATNVTDHYWRRADNALLPIVPLRWPEARRYCEWLGGRLPTNAEWEKAARGENGRLRPWLPDPEDPTDPYIGSVVGVCAYVNCGLDPDTLIAEVGSYPQGAGPYGHLDLLGNVEEWVLDWADFYGFDDEVDPTGPESTPWGERTIRGHGTSGYNRQSADPEPPADTWRRGMPYGVRCAFDAPPEPLLLY